MPRITERTLALAIIAALSVAGLALVYFMYQGQSVAAQGTYELVMTFPESGIDSEENMGETFAPCFNQGNCNFSCNASNVGRSCSNLVCTGAGNGDSAYFYTHDYVCVYNPPTCTPDSSCAADTCTTDTCTATNADCTTSQIPGNKDCSVPCTMYNSCGQSNTGVMIGDTCSVAPPPDSGCPVDPPPTCANGSPGPYPACPLGDDPPVCVPEEGDDCNVNVCGDVGGTVQCDGSCSGALPAPVDQCPDLIGTQCSATACPGGGGGGGGGGGACPNPDTASIIATPNRVNTIDTADILLEWLGDDLDAASCTVTNLNTGAPVKPATTVTSCSMNDSFTVTGGITAQTTFRLTCGSLVRDAVVNVVPRFEEF